MKLPLVSFVIPTYNEERNIGRCLKSIFAQDYPKDKIEVIIIDDGSTDRTREICTRYSVRIIYSGRHIIEFSVRLGIEAADGEFVALLGADNELLGKDWILKMARPMLEDKEIVGAHTSILAPREDSAINRYCCGLLQTGAPLEYYLMQRPKEVMAKEDYFVQTFREDSCLAIGENGTLFRRDAVASILRDSEVNTLPGDDLDLIYRLTKEGFTKYAYVPQAGVYHHFVVSYWDFIKKLRIKCKKFSQTWHKRQYPWLPRQRGELFRTLKWVVFCSTFVGPLIHGFFMRKKRDPAWLYHPFACFTAVVVYATTLLFSKKGPHLILRMIGSFFS